MTRYLSLLLVVVGILFGASVVLDFELEGEDTVKLKAFIDPDKDGSKPVNTSYNVAVTLRGPRGTQPDLVTGFDLFIAATQLRRNGKKFPAPCTKEDIDDKKTIPSKCNSGLIATGTATASVGAPGSKRIASKELSVKLFNADGGRLALLVVNGTGEHPIHNCVIIGEAKEASGKFRWVTVFKIPDALQTVPGTLIPSVITRTSMKLESTFRGLGFVQLITCPPDRRIPAKIVYHFNDSPSKSASATIPCRRAS